MGTKISGRVPIVVPVKPRGADADDLEGLAVDADRLADRAGREAEARLPRVVRQHDRMRFARGGVVAGVKRRPAAGVRPRMGK